MAKSNKQQQGHKSQKNSGGGRAGSVTENIEKSAAGRERNRKVAKLLESRRRPERESGEFYIRTNSGRSSDLGAILRGEFGDYAIPGGAEPSVHLSVQREVRKHDTISAVRLESIQKGHELEGAVFDPKVYLPCGYIEKFGSSFQSRFTDRLAAASQELLCHYLAAKYAEAPTMTTEIEPVKEVDPFAEASIDHKLMLSEVRGRYLVHGPDGDVVFKVFGPGRIRVLASKSPRLVPSEAYVAIHRLFKPSLDQVTDDDTYEKQLAIFMFLRNELGEIFAGSMPTATEAPKRAEEDPNLTQADRDAIAKAKARRERKPKKKFIQQREEQDQLLAKFAIKQNCIPVQMIVSGTLGYVDLSSSSGELVMQSCMVGADRVMRVEVLGDSHMLKLAGIKMGDCILANFVRFGISAIDRTNLRMSDEEYRKQSVLAQHVREQIEARGLRFIRPAVAA